MPKKEQYQKNPEKYKKENKEYRKTERGKILHRKSNKEWIKQNPECQKEYLSKYYQNNKKNWQERYQIKYRKLKQFVQEYKLKKGCSICGYNKCASALVFHHNGDKEFDIGNASYSLGLDVIKKEMDKCIILCRNCHAELHEKERKVI